MSNKQQHHCFQVVFLSLVTLLFFLFQAVSVDAQAVVPQYDADKIYVSADGHFDWGEGIRVLWWGDVAFWTYAKIYRCDDFSSDPRPGVSEPVNCTYIATWQKDPKTTFFDTSAEPGKYYWYKVKVCDEDSCSAISRYSSYDGENNGESSHIHGAWVGSMPARPKTPTSIKVLNHSEYSVEISWTGMDPRMTDFFQLYRCTTVASASCEHIPWWDPYHQKFQDYAFNVFYALDGTSVKPGKNYYYRVKACAQGVKKDDSSIICSWLSNYGHAPPTEVPDAPKNLSASDGLKDVIVITWSKVLEAAYYNVYRNSGYIDKTFGNYDYYYDRRAKTNNKHTYTVTACNSLGCSGMSNSDSGFMVTSSNQAALGMMYLLLLDDDDEW